LPALTGSEAKPRTITLPFHDARAGIARRSAFICRSHSLRRTFAPRRTTSWPVSAVTIRLPEVANHGSSATVCAEAGGVGTRAKRTMVATATSMAVVVRTRERKDETVEPGDMAGLF
jgi:hypothetical protein